MRSNDVLHTTDEADLSIYTSLVNCWWLYYKVHANVCLWISIDFFFFFRRVMCDAEEAPCPLSEIGENRSFSCPFLSHEFFFSCRHFPASCASGRPPPLMMRSRLGLHGFTSRYVFGAFYRCMHIVAVINWNDYARFPIQNTAYMHWAFDGTGIGRLPLDQDDWGYRSAPCKKR